MVCAACSLLVVAHGCEKAGGAMGLNSLSVEGDRL
jgi:hypothetical protein